MLTIRGDVYIAYGDVFADDLCYSTTFGLFYSRWFTGFSGEDEGEKLLGIPVVQW